MRAEKGTLLATTCGRCGARNAPEAAYCIQCMEAFGPLTLPKPPLRLRGPAPTNGAIPPPPPAPPAAPFPDATDTVTDVSASNQHQPAAQVTAPGPMADTTTAPHPQAEGTTQAPGADPVDAIAMPSDAEIAALLRGSTSLEAASPALTLTETEIAEGRERLNEDGVGIVNGKPIWQCVQCAYLQPLTNFVCSQCGTRFGAERVDPVANANFKRMEMMFPGYGFFQSGHLFIALTRILIATSWLATAIFVAFQRPVVAIPLIAGVGVLWALGPQDIEQVLLGHEPRLNGRGLLILITLVLLAFIFVGAADFYLGTSGLNQ